MRGELMGNSLPHKSACEYWTAWWATWSRRSFAESWGNLLPLGGFSRLPSTWWCCASEKSRTSRWSITLGG